MFRLTRFFLFLYYFSLTYQTFMGLPKIFQNNNPNNKTNSSLEIKVLSERVLEKNEKIRFTTDDFKTFMQIWATMFVFTFPIIVIPYKSGERE